VRLEVRHISWRRPVEEDAERHTLTASVALGARAEEVYHINGDLIGDRVDAVSQPVDVTHALILAQVPAGHKYYGRSFCDDATYSGADAPDGVE